MGLLNRFKKNKTQEKPTEQKQIGRQSEEKKPTVSVKAGVVGSDVILRPIVTEKSAYLAVQSQYIFEVQPRANKVQVKDAIRKMYSITPVSVNIQSVEGKKVRRGRVQGKRKDWKKAIVTLPKGKKIEVYEGV